MAQFTSFSEKTPHSRNEVFVNTSRDKQEGYNKRVLPDSKLKTESTNNNSNRTINEPYETQDSAYSTSDSSYNTVDSSYSQRSNSSGYSTLEIKWKQPQSKHDFEKRRNDLHKIDGERMPGQFGSDSALAFQLSDPNSKQIKFVDDIDDSDTATETETDTELTLSSSAIEPDMSYVPDYIRTVSAPISFVAPAITTASFTVSRPIIASTMTSSVVSVSTSTKPSTASVKDETCAMSPIKSSSNDRRRADKNMSYTGYRENYERKQKEKVCGRKSLDERLKSLESGAAVKLQVCKGSQNRRQKTEKEDITSTSRPLSSTAKAYSRPRTRSSDHDHNQSNIEQDLQVEPTPTRAPPPPDIIESHQPRVSTQASPSRGSDDRPTPTNDDQRNFPKYAKPSSFSDPLSKSTSERTKSEARNVHVAIKWKTATPPTPRRQLSDVPMKGQDLQSGTEDLKVSAQSFESKYAAEISDVVNSETPQSPSRIETTSSKLSWKRPSQEALNRLNESVERTKSPALNTVSSSMVEPHTTPTTSNSLFEVEKPFERGEGLLQRRGAPVSLVVDVPADNNPVANVELRSLPTEADGSDRSYLRGKRNARMFALPSSDDNENDNFVSKGYRHVENRTVRVAPVKFVPSVLRRSRSRSARGEDSQSSSTSSLVADVKIITSEHPKSYPSNPSEEQSLRKSSRTPKRSNSKKNRSKSTHDRPSTEAKTYSHSRTLSSGSHSPVPVSSGGSSDRYKQSSPETPVRSRNHRSGGKSSRNSSKNRYKTEYAELTNVKRTTPRSNRKLLEASSLPSPRQLAVAHAVKFGFTGNEGTIPYIDETNSPEEQKKQIIENPSKDLSSDVRPHDADNATLKRAFPLGRRGRSMKKKEVSRTTSYMEAVGSSDDVTHASEADKSRSRAMMTDSNNLQRALSGKLVRYNSADSVLSSADAHPNVALRKHVRSSSADRSSLKGVNRRSYQIATTTPQPSKPAENNVLLRPSSHKRQPSIRRLKNFFAESTQPMIEGQVEEGRRASRGRLLGPVPTLSLQDYDDSVVREGFLHFKVATIEKGKRTSAQKSWKLIWVVLKEQKLYLCKDWTRNKLDVSPGGQNSNSTSGSGQPPSELPLEEEEPLNIQGSLISIAYNYVKRKNVFKVITGNGSEYLFQAEDGEDMLAWITSIQVSGNHDNKDGKVTVNKDLILKKTNQIESGRISLSSRSPLIPKKLLPSPKPDKRNMRKSRSPKPVRRMTVPIKDIDGSRRFKWRGSVNRIVRKFGQGQTLMQGGTFDVHLEDCPPSVNNELVPFVVELCCRIVEEKGLSFTGIYRVPGNSGTLSALQEELNIRGADAVDPENDERFCELNVVSSLLKSFFRKLPDPLFTNELYDDFISMNRKKDPEERLNGLRRLIHMLPAPHFETLKFLVNHLKAVANNSEVNKMEVRNLAIVFGPTLVRSSACDNMATMVTDMSDQCRIVESVLQHADWFFAEDESHDSDVQALPVPCDDNHEPVPNIDHLLANVGRTPGDISDSTSESSKSKASCVSEKESFSRDVMERIFGAGKRWKQNLAQPDSKPNEEESSDDEFGFKEAKRNQAKAATEPTKTAPQTTPSAPSKYRVAKPAASGIRAGWPNKGHHHASDIPARLYDFYVDNLERMPKNETSQSLPMSSSSTESSPKVTRNSQLRSSLRQTQTGYPLKSHQASNVRLPSNADPGTTHNFRQKDGLTSSPHQPQSYSKASPHDVQRSQRALSSIPVLATSTPMHSGQHSDKVKQSKTGYNPSELSSIEKTMDRSEESDSDSSVYVGDTLEEKLKNLTNLDKKLERRPSRRLANRNHGIFLKITPSSVEGKTATNKKLTTAPSLQAGERITSDNLHMYSKKTTKELYEERKAQRQQHREIFKANRDNRKDNNADRFASGDNAFDRSDPKRQLLRSGSRDDVSVSRRPRQSKEKVKRRHTLGGNDFPAQELWDQPHHASLQNVNQDVPGSAMARLRPQVGASVSSISSKFVPPTRFLEYRSSFRREKSRRTESYL